MLILMYGVQPKNSNIYERCSTMKALYALLCCLLFVSTGQGVDHEEVLFSPHGHPTARLLELINCAQHTIHVAIYMLADEAIVSALGQAKKRGVDVQVIVDQSSMRSRRCKGRQLKHYGIATYVFRAPRRMQKKITRSRFKTKRRCRRNKRSIARMHHKFALIDNKLWNGSFNWTKKADQENYENIVITDNPVLYKKFQECFGRLKRVCRINTRRRLCPQDLPRIL